MLIDSHCHLHDCSFFTEEQAKAALEKALENDVQKIICIGTSHQDSLMGHEYCRDLENIFWTYGWHPETVTDRQDGNDGLILDFHQSYDLGKRLISEAVKKPVAIGEVGLDYHYDNQISGSVEQNHQDQRLLLEQMLQLASDFDLPVSFHIREAFDDFYAILDNFQSKKIRGVVHSFTDSRENLEKALQHDFYVGVNGIATFAKVELPPLEVMLLETDAPFLTPVPFRGKINEPAYIRNICEYLSLKLGVPCDELAEQTTKNVQQLFRI